MAWNGRGRLGGLAGIAEPVEPQAPCGPDLSAAQDHAFLWFLIRLEKDLPQAFPPGDDVLASLAALDREILGWLGETRDVRLLVALARSRVLQRNLGGTVDAFAAIRWLLEHRWETVPPVADRKTGLPQPFEERVQYVALLANADNMRLPIQFAARLALPDGSDLVLRTGLVGHDVFGYRFYHQGRVRAAVPAGDAPAQDPYVRWAGYEPMEDEAVVHPDDFRTAMLATCADDRLALRRELDRLAEALDGISRACAAQGASDPFGRTRTLARTVRDMIALVP